MLTREISLPVRVPDLHFGFAYGLGVLKAGHSGLVLEIEIKEAFLNTGNLGSRELRIDFGALTTVSLHAGWIRTAIIIQTNTLKALQGFPGAKGCELRLQVASKDRAVAAELVSTVTLEIESRRVQQMIQHLEQPPEGPPATT
jgi:hypothetical protein